MNNPKLKMIRGIDTSHKIVEERRANIGIKE